MDVTVVWEKANVLSLNRAKLEFGCIVELAYHCPIMTRRCPCGSVGRANTDVVLVHDSHGGVHSTLLTCMNIVNGSRPVRGRQPETCIWQSSRYLDHKSSSMVYMICAGYSVVNQYCTYPKNCMHWVFIKEVWYLEF